MLMEDKLPGCNVYTESQLQSHTFYTKIIVIIIIIIIASGYKLQFKTRQQIKNRDNPHSLTELEKKKYRQAGWNQQTDNLHVLYCMQQQDSQTVAISLPWLIPMLSNLTSVSVNHETFQYKAQVVREPGYQLENELHN